VLGKGGSGPLKYFGTLEASLRAAYPEINWEADKFVHANRTPPGYWANLTNISKALEQAEVQLGITKVSTTLIQLLLIF